MTNTSQSIKCHQDCPYKAQMQTISVGVVSIITVLLVVSAIDTVRNLKK